MKKYKIAVATILIGGMGFLSSCDSQQKDSENLKEFKTYVNNVSDDAEADWSEIEKNYQSKEMAVKNDMEEMSEESKKEFEDLKNEFNDKKMKANEMKMKNDEEMANTSMDNNPDAPVNKMYSIVMSADRDMTMNGVTADNLLSVYTNFVDYIDVNKDAMSFEDWNEAELIWDALNERKNVVEPNLASKDNLQVAKQKTRYAGIKTANKPASKIKDKVETEKERNAQN